MTIPSGIGGISPDDAWKLQSPEDALDEQRRRREAEWDEQFQEPDDPYEEDDDVN